MSNRTTGTTTVTATAREGSLKYIGISTTDYRVYGHVDMKLVYVNVQGLEVPVCESCLAGEHQSYGHDHRGDTEGRRGCKNVSDDHTRQCCCTQDWPELFEVVASWKEGT